MGVAESILKAALFVLVASTGEKFAARRTGRGATSTRLSSVALKLMLKRDERRKISTGNRQLAGGNNGGSGSREGTARDLIAAISASMRQLSYLLARPTIPELPRSMFLHQRVHSSFLPWKYVPYKSPRAFTRSLDSPALECPCTPFLPPLLHL